MVYTVNHLKLLESQVLKFKGFKLVIDVLGCKPVAGIPGGSCAEA